MIISNLIFRGKMETESIFAGIVSGLFFGLFFRKIFTSTYKRLGEKQLKQIVIILDEDEELIKEAGANHFKGKEAVGGKLALTNKRLVFKSHKLNLQNHEQSFSISSSRCAFRVDYTDIQYQKHVKS
ncbi:hypothetical protein [Chryseosolibacter indicus]|nr:hypothetical protein [Chryseosolibacter indicus]